MKKLLLLTITTFLFAQTPFLNGLQRAYAEEQRDACALAKSEAREKYNVQSMDVGCLCEKSDSKEWTCVAKFTYLLKPTEK